MKKLILCLMFCILLLGTASAFNWTGGNLISYYRLDNPSGVVYDMQRTYDGTNYGSTRGVTGKLNDAFSFDGNDYFTFTKQTYNNLSINWWGKISDNTAHITSDSTETGANTNRIFLNNNLIQIQTSSNNSVLGGYTFLEDTTFRMYTITRGDNNWSLYVNGVYINSTSIEGTIDLDSFGVKPNYVSSVSNYSGVLDEIGIWNKSLNASEITELYNVGNALPYGGTGVGVITLDYPTDDLTLSDTGEYFNVSFNDISVNYNWTNVTYYVWNGTGTLVLFNETSVNLAGDASDNSLFIDSFTLDNYTWNAYGCYENTTWSACDWATNRNFTFDVAPFTTISESYYSTTLEGSTDLFTANVSFLSGQRLSSVVLTYNGTNYDADFTEYDTDTYYLSRRINIPLVTANTNLTFYWNISLESGFYQTTTSHNQTVANLVLDNCSVGNTYLFNFTLLDEDTQAQITTGTRTILIDFKLSSLASSDLNINFSQKFTDVSNPKICSNVDLSNSQFRLDGIIEYGSTGRYVEFYNIQNYTLTNATDNQNISLYNLNSSIGQEFKITYKDSNFNTVTDALIQIQRLYIDEGKFKTIEIPKTGGDGYTVAHLVGDDEIYNLIVIKEGRLLATFENVIAHCQNPSLEQCEININSFASSISPTSFSTNGDYSVDLRYNKTTRVVSAIFVTLSGVQSLNTLNVSLYDAYGNTSVCTDSLNSAGGTLSCTIPATYGNSSVMVKVYQNGILKKSSMIMLGSDPSDIYGSNLIFLGLIIILTIVGMSTTDNPMYLGLMLIFSLIVMIGLRLIWTPNILGDGATIMWAVVGIILILIKGSNRQ